MNQNLPSSITKGDSYEIVGTLTANGPSGASYFCGSDKDGVVSNISELTTIGTHKVYCTASTGANVNKSTDTYITITYDPYTITNLITNGSFENGTDGWQKGDNSTFGVSNGVAIITAPTDAWDILVGTDYVIGNSSTYLHEFYLAVRAKVPSTSYAYGFGINTTGGYTFVAPYINYEINQYTKSSIVVSPSTYISASDFYFGLYKRIATEIQETVYIDYVLIIDLTATFGSGNEPDKEWCDRHINYFDGSKIIYK